MSSIRCPSVGAGRCARCAAVAESVEPPLLRLHRTVPRDDLAARTETGLLAACVPGPFPDAVIDSAPEICRSR
ncbi:hypothetical protein CW362_17585 [Streptomyces populi]|uniref:Uncharacterized protein n=1 Tax=Streptomyces populi TaxID=2058924 RepID=A0A2I0SP70_9ACTN|nr:hypothetical protein CW362_17585 [Streptomyces populi]